MIEEENREIEQPLVGMIEEENRILDYKIELEKLIQATPLEEEKIKDILIKVNEDSAGKEIEILMPLLRKEMTRMSLYRKELMKLIEKYGRYIVINKDQHKSLELSIITNGGNPEDTEILKIHKLHPCTKIKKIINKTKLAWPNRLEESDEIQLFYNKTRMNPSEHVICSGLAFDKVNVIKAITVINKVQTKGKTIPQFNVDIDDVRMDEEFNDRTPTAPIDPALMVSDINEEDITDNFRDLITQKAEAATSTRRPKGRPRKIENLNMGETCNYNKSANLAKNLIQIAKGKDISQSGDAEIEKII